MATPITGSTLAASPVAHLAHRRVARLAASAERTIAADIASTLAALDARADLYRLQCEISADRILDAVAGDRRAAADLGTMPVNVWGV